jgi:hypothetical protein
MKEAKVMKDKGRLQNKRREDAGRGEEEDWK